VIIDSYNTYISRCLKAQTILKQCEKKISYFLQISIEIIRKEIIEFIQLPLRHICILNDLFQSFILKYSDFDWTIIQSKIKKKIFIF